MNLAERWIDVARIGAESPRWVRAWWSSWARPVPFALLMAGALVARRGKDVDLVAASPETAVAEALAARGLLCDNDDVAWLVGPKGVVGSVAGGGKALVRARTKDE